MQIITSDARRHITTPNATMTTLASPSVGGAASSVWIVRMDPGVEGPEHAFEDEVVWAVTQGEAILQYSNLEARLQAGDTVVLPGRQMRRFVAGAAGFEAFASTRAPGTVTRGDDGSTAVPPWVA